MRPAMSFLTAMSEDQGTDGAREVPRRPPRRLGAVRRNAPHEPDARPQRAGDRPEHARHHRAQAVRGTARAPGAARRIDRPGEPRPVPRPGAARARPPAARRPAGLGALHGPRRLQDDQRLARPRGRRPGPARHRRAAPRQPAHGGHRRAAGRRRVRGPARGRRRGRHDRSRRRRADPLDARRAVPPGRDRGLRPSEHRDLGRGARRRAGERRGAPAERRRRDVPREGEGQEPVPAVRAGDARHRAEAPGAEGRAAARAGAQRVPALLSAGDRTRERQGLGRGGVDPLVPPGARDGAAARLHPARGGDRAHRADRPLGPAGGLPIRGRAPGPLPTRPSRCTWP